MIAQVTTACKWNWWFLFHIFFPLRLNLTLKARWKHSIWRPETLGQTIDPATHCILKNQWIHVSFNQILWMSINNLIELSDPTWLRGNVSGRTPTSGGAWCEVQADVRVRRKQASAETLQHQTQLLFTLKSRRRLIFTFTANTLYTILKITHHGRIQVRNLCGDNTATWWENSIWPYVDEESTEYRSGDYRLWFVQTADDVNTVQSGFIGARKFFHIILLLDSTSTFTFGTLFVFYFTCYLYSCVFRYFCVFFFLLLRRNHADVRSRDVRVPSGALTVNQVQSREVIHQRVSQQFVFILKARRDTRRCRNDRK